MRLLFFIAALLVAPAALACSMFTLVRDGEVVMGNNEDARWAGYVWYTPAADGVYARINFGFKDAFAQGAMNEKGLCFDAAVVPEVPYTPDPQKETVERLLEKIMNECATVDEAVAYFEQYNCADLASANFMLADAGGKAAVVTWAPPVGLNITRRSGDYLLNTNDRLCTSGYRDPRYTLGERELKTPTVSAADAARKALAVMHQEGEGAFTSYSNIYRPDERSVSVYQLADFDHTVTFNFADPPDEKPRPLAKLFEGGPAIHDLKRAMPREYDTRIPISPEDLQAYTGVYRVEEGAVDVRVTVIDDLIQMDVPGQQPVLAYFEGQDRFRLRDFTGQISFERSGSGEVIAMTMHRARDGRAVRVGAL